MADTVIYDRTKPTHHTAGVLGYAHCSELADAVAMVESFHRSTCYTKIRHYPQKQKYCT